MKIKKILLIVPPCLSFKNPRQVDSYPPIGLGYLASVVENMGMEIKILDCVVNGWENDEEVDNKMIRVGLSDKDILSRISDYNPDMVGLACSFSNQHRIFHHLFSLIKKDNPNRITVGGGAHATICSEEVLSDKFCDFVLLGEAEESFKDLILALNNYSDLTSIDGLGWKINHKLVINKKNKWIENLDSVSFPAYHIMGLDKYFLARRAHGLRHRDRFCPVITSRGCPARCTFCNAKAVWGNKYRMRSVENVIEEMRLLSNNYGIQEIMFEDDNLTLNPVRARALFSSMKKEGFNFIWDTPNGVGSWSLDESLLDLMKESGCIRLNFPVESGSQSVLEEIIKKPLNLSRIKQLIAHCKKIGLSYSIFLVIGMPGEKIEDIWKSFRFAAECGCFSPNISVATPYPGSQLFIDSEKNGYFSRKFTLSDLYTSSFLIRTKEWSEAELRKTLLKGHIYFKSQLLLHEPMLFLKWIFGMAKKNKWLGMLTYIKQLLITRKLV